jgi:excisionase family DNA binding protein
VTLAAHLSEQARTVPRIALTPAEAAESLGCSAEFFRAHVDHELRWIRRGRKRFVPLVELERWAEANAERTL